MVLNCQSTENLHTYNLSVRPRRTFSLTALSTTSFSPPDSHSSYCIHFRLFHLLPPHSPVYCGSTSRINQLPSFVILIKFEYNFANNPSECGPACCSGVPHNKRTPLKRRDTKIIKVAHSLNRTRISKREKSQRKYQK